MERIISAIVLIPAAIYLVLQANANIFTAALSVVILISISEYLSIVSIDRSSLFALVLFVLGVTYPFLTADIISIGTTDIFIVMFLIFAVLSVVSKTELKHSLEQGSLSILGFIYIPYFLSYAVLFKNGAMGPWFLMLICVIVWSNDICAYYIGKTFGKNKLAERVSPKKTYEGMAGGLMGGIAAVFIFNYFHPVGFSNIELFLFAVVVGFAGVYGDLFESLIKRVSNVKDSGTLIPGHGGVLDRIDSLIFAIPVGWYALYIPELFK